MEVRTTSLAHGSSTLEAENWLTRGAPNQGTAWMSNDGFVRISALAYANLWGLSERILVQAH